MPACQRKILQRIESGLVSLLHELQRIWDEIGESDDERDRVLLELEQDCLQVYRRKVDQANRCRAQLRQEIADAEAELAAICSAMGERPVHIRQSNQHPESLKAELRMILPKIEELRKRKNDRKNQVFEILVEIQSIKNEIFSSDGISSNETAHDEVELSVKKLEELHKELQALRKEKNKRQRVILDGLNSLHSLCVVLGLDFKKIANNIHPSLGEAESSKNISHNTIEQVGTVIQQLRELKLHRMQQLQDLTTSLLELWDLMDTPIEEQQIFQKVTCKLAASEDEITEPDILSIEYINYVSAEVSRLEEFKASKMKELVLKKKAELETICRKTHLIPERDSEMEKGLHAIESGAVDAACMLDQIELKIARAKEEALSRKEIIEKVEKWKAACEEESWVEKYDRDDNRYAAGRGAHLTLKHAEKARALVNKLPAMVETLASKTIAWENDKGNEFIYDGVRLLTMLEGYKVLRKDKELRRKRQREQKKHQGHLLTEQEVLYGSKPSPLKNHPSVKKAPRLSYGGASNRKVSLGAPVSQTLATKNPSVNKAPRLSYGRASNRKVSLGAPVSQPLATKNLGVNKAPRLSCGGASNRKVSLGAPVSQPLATKNLGVNKAPRLSCGGASNRKVTLGAPVSQTLGTKNPSVNKAPRLSYGGACNREVSLGAPVSQTRVTPPTRATPNIRIAKKNECVNQDHRKDDRPAALSSVRRRCPSMAGVNVKQHSSNLKQHSSNLLKAREAELPMVRTPFSPISSATPSKSNAANIMEDLHRKHDELRQKLLTINSTPPKMMSRAGQENRTPQKTPTPSTPPMVSIPMQTAITPTSTLTPTIIPALSSTKSVEDEIEYSFEERRAQFVLSRSPLMKVAHVRKYEL